MRSQPPVLGMFTLPGYIWIRGGNCCKKRFAMLAFLQTYGDRGRI